MSTDDKTLSAELAELCAELLQHVNPDRCHGCHGDKCRLPTCYSCCGEDDAEAAMESLKATCTRAWELIAKAKGESSKKLSDSQGGPLT